MGRVLASVIRQIENGVYNDITKKAQKLQNPCGMGFFPWSQHISKELVTSILKIAKVATHKNSHKIIHAQWAYTKDCTKRGDHKYAFTQSNKQWDLKLYTWQYRQEALSKPKSWHATTSYTLNQTELKHHSNSEINSIDPNMGTKTQPNTFIKPPWKPATQIKS